MKVLVVDDEEVVRIPIRDDLVEAGHEVVCEERGEAAAARLEENGFDVLVTDLRMPGIDGLELLEHARRAHPDTAVIMITAHATVESAVEAMRRGAYDYIVKPFDIDKLLMVLERLGEHRELEARTRRLQAQLEERHSFGRLVGKSPAMQKVYQLLDIVVAGDSTVLVSGQTGTGKERVAEAIHYNSRRRDGPLIKVSCAALSRDVLESELFGHVRGAYTGATRGRQGRFALADGGCIFLDEVDDIPLESQVKLLRVLESQEFERVGDGGTCKVDVRIIAATKVDLRDLVAEKRFRDDLYYRLNVVPVHLPPLVDRREDIPLLVEHFLTQAGDDSPQVTPQAMALLIGYAWPGNVRELANLVERLALVRRGQSVEADDLPVEIRGTGDGAAVEPRSFDETVAAVERRLLLEALDRAAGNKTRAAELLGMSPSTFRYKLAALIDESAG